jgi:anthranilate 3-monooxygenase (FAD)/4-hydroxyphenylacetate 3-monooxygenase
LYDAIVNFVFADQERDMGIRTGKEYIQGLRKGTREVWLRGERVADVTTHPAFARPLAHTAGLFDLQHDPAHRDVLTWRTPSGDLVGTSYLPCGCHDRGSMEYE